ncbi:MAG: tyrosine-type recombinase/integrase [Acidobacteria bacterium]|nr:tyrosine-type recombinase/integrase [Acidobacteriota bacterium]
MAGFYQRVMMRLEDKRWVAYLYVKAVDLSTGKCRWNKRRIGVLGAKSQMTARQARSKLERITGHGRRGAIERITDGPLITLGRFTRQYFFPLREGSSWKEATAETRKSAIEQDILQKFGELPLSAIDKVMLQAHLNDLASRLSEGRVRHARLYLKAIFEEAVEQELLSKNPAGKLALPKQLRPVDRTTLTWDQLRLVLGSVSLRDRILLTLDMTETFRPSELFALRWKSFDRCARTLSVTHTAYRGKLRDFGKTKRSLRTVYLPDGLANELWLWKQDCGDVDVEAFIFPNARKRNGAKTNGFLRTDNYRARVLKKIGQQLGLPKLNFQVLRRTIATLAQTKGGVKDVQAILGHSKADTTVNVYMQPIEAGVKQTLDAIYSELTKRNEMPGS